MPKNNPADEQNTTEENLEKKCTVVCWPWGEYDIISIESAKSVGYLGAVRFVPGVNLINSDLGRWHISRFPPERNIEKFEKLLRHYAFPLKARLLKNNYLTDRFFNKVVRRLNDRKLWASIRRKLVD